jgi:hypothetical protein
MGVENALVVAVIQQNMRANAALAPTAIGALAAVATMVANVPGMMDANSNGWQKLSTDLDTLLEHLDGALAEGEDWIADDKKAFEASLKDFKGVVAELKQCVNDIGSALELCANAYIVAYVALAGLAVACLVILIGLAILRLYPPAAPGATALMMKVGTLLTFLSTKISLLMSTLLFGLATFAGSTVYGLMQMKAERKAIPTAQRFEQIRIDYKAPDKFLAKQI